MVKDKTANTNAQEVSSNWRYDMGKYMELVKISDQVRPDSVSEVMEKYAYLRHLKSLCESVLSGLLRVFPVEHSWNIPVKPLQ